MALPRRVGSRKRLQLVRITLQVSRLRFDVFQQLQNFFVVLLWRCLNVWRRDQQRGSHYCESAATTTENLSFHLCSSLNFPRRGFPFRAHLRTLVFGRSPTLSLPEFCISCSKTRRILVPPLGRSQ